MATKYVFVGGGVASSLGKGTASASIGALLEASGYRVTLKKIDPYLNVDAGTMNPLQHGEVYVTDDGAETDLDLGNYERFTKNQTTQSHIITTGKIYQRVLKKERAGAYLGACVQVIPHISQEVKEAISEGVSPDTDVVIIEIGGTAGDIESNLYFEVARQMIIEKGSAHVAFVFVTLVPRISGANEMKTKPTQHAVQKLREMGIQPDILLCRCDTALTDLMKEKISLFTNVSSASIISAVDLEHTIYELPLSYNKAGLTQALLKHLKLPVEVVPNLERWKKLVEVVKNPKGSVRIALVGKYTKLKDADISVFEALSHAGFFHRLQVNVVPIDSSTLQADTVHETLSGFDGVVVPGGFGHRGIDGKILAIEYARKKRMPYLGICLGAQLMVIEFARHVLGYVDADSTEFNTQTNHPVVALLASQREITDKGGTMRLGAHTTQLRPNSLLAKIYKSKSIRGRHRHRYEIDAAYSAAYAAKGLAVAGESTQDGIPVVEAVYWENHPFGVGVQYHPELQSKPFAAEPLFSALIEAAWKEKNT